ERVGRFGKFVGCTGYPQCKYVKKGPRPRRAKGARGRGPRRRDQETGIGGRSDEWQPPGEGDDVEGEA
ncbi:hypothetical protein FJY71_07225, partial [candidate division WOR-3 bacterium]|nr:hypothetical protein [candidate division WOR-3 bacterium]